jgi:hypothetical protein
MLGRRKRAGAPNAVAVPLTAYTTDPVGWSMFDHLSRSLNGWLTGSRAVVTPDNWSGWANGGQTMTGMANLGRGVPRTQKNSTLDQEVSMQLTDPAQRIFYQRLSRQLNS